MRAVVQKTLTSSVTSDGVLVGKAAEGLTVLLASPSRILKRTPCTWPIRSFTCESLKMKRGN